MKTTTLSQTFKTAYLAIRILFAILGGIEVASAQQKGPDAAIFISDGNLNTVDMNAVETALKGWPASSATTAKAYVTTYGLPNEIRPLMLIWKNKGPWEQVIVYKEAMSHEYPKKHVDVVEQTIHLQIAQNKIREVSDFARECGILIYHSKGEISSCCDMEAANVLAFNLVYEIVNGTKTAEQAKQLYAEQMKTLLKGQFSAYTQQMLFVKGQIAAK